MKVYLLEQTELGKPPRVIGHKVVAVRELALIIPILNNSISEGLLLSMLAEIGSVSIATNVGRVTLTAMEVQRK